MAQFKGIDVSEWQGVIDWDKVKAAGIQFAIIRAGRGQGTPDKQWKRNADECTRVGIPFGVYWFSYAYTVEMAKAEARHCIAAIKPYRLSYPVAFDYEYDSLNTAKKHGVNVTEKLVSDMTRAFCTEIENAGYYALNYSNVDFLSRFIDDAAERRYGLWIAAPDRSSPPRTCQMWQYSWKGKINGINADVDMNISYVDFPAIINKPTAAPEQPVQPEQPKPWYEADGSWAQATMLGLMDGTRPEDKLTRAELAAVALRLVKMMKEGA